VAGRPSLAELIIDAAREAPDSVAVVSPDCRLTYAELTDAALALAGRLEAWGLQPGDRVVLYSQNSAGYLVIALGTWLAGGVFATAYPDFGATELAYVMVNAAPRIVLAESGREDAAEAAAHAAGGRTAVLTVDGLGARELPEARPLDAPTHLDSEAPALICYTSGSTATPKPVTHSHGGAAAGARAYADVWHLGTSDRTLVCLPMAWLYGLTTSAIATLVAGGTVVVAPKYNPVHVTDMLVRERVTFFPGVTTMFVKLERYLRELAPTPDLRSLRLCVSGGEPRNEPSFARWRELTGCSVHDVYCASECWPVVTYDPIAEPEPVPGSAGIVVPGSSMRVVDEAGVDLAAGETGAALWRAPALMLGYWNEPELTAAAFTQDGWYRSGDFVRLDDDGHVFVVGRASDVIIRAGSNVSPVEVELVLARHPDIAEAAVVGIPDPEYGEEVAAGIVVTPDGSFDPDGFARFCAGELAPYKVPTVFRQFEALPRTATGKVARKAIRPLFADGQLTT
jgi:long-chain acyl-CoA synthetase